MGPLGPLRRFDSPGGRPAVLQRFTALYSALQRQPSASPRTLGCLGETRTKEFVTMGLVAMTPSWQAWRAFTAQAALAPMRIVAKWPLVGCVDKSRR